MKNANFVGFWNRCFRWSERLVCYIKRRKSYKITIYLRDLWHGNTWGYKGLLGVTRGYRGLQGVTGSDKGWQGVTKDYTNFFLTRTFPDTFSWSILHKIKVKEISNFWPKRWPSPFAKMLLLWVFETDVFVAQKDLFAI